MSKYEYSESMEVAAHQALRWFIANGCPWAEMKDYEHHQHRVPTLNEIKLEYTELFLTAKQHSSPFCESGELRIEIAPLRYGYKVASGEPAGRERSGLRA
jgi:hypothetical protein